MNKPSIYIIVPNTAYVYNYDVNTDVLMQLSMIV